MQDARRRRHGGGPSAEERERHHRPPAAEFGRALSHPEVAERLTAQGAEPRPSRPEVFGEFMRTETTKWAQLVKETGIKAE